jgi:deoxyadenosine/deoxycytidine kinase
MGTYRAIAGTIGAGKTTLCRKLSRYMVVGYEPKSPYLERFYKNPKKWAFHMQIWMMQYRYRQATELMAGDTKGLQDRTSFEDSIFREMLYDQGNLSKTEYQMLQSIHHRYWNHNTWPSQIIYLSVSAETSIARVRERNRDAEIDVSDEYLRDLHRRYEEWAKDNEREPYFHIVDWNEPNIDKITEIWS